MTHEPGTLLVIKDIAPDDVGLEWLIVRYHPDDPKLALLVPIDTFPFVGTPDLRCDNVNVARCGWSVWTTLAGLESVAVGKSQHLTQVRGLLGNLARGITPQPGNPSVDADPNYEEWIGKVAKVCGNLTNLADTRNSVS